MWKENLGGSEAAVLALLLLLPPHALGFSGGGVRARVISLRTCVPRCAAGSPAQSGGSGRVIVFECRGDQRLENCIRKEFENREGAGSAGTGVEELVHLGAVHVRKCKENKKGRVLLPWSRRIEDGQIRRGSLVRVHTHPSRFPVDQVDWSRRRLFEDDNYVIVDKPAGIPFQATHDNFRECVVQVSDRSNNQRSRRPQNEHVPGKAEMVDLSSAIREARP